MKKINLMDIMESLNSDNEADAQAALHEWFVEQSKTVVSKLTESEEDDSEEETEEQVEEAHDYGMMEAQPEDVMSGGGAVGMVDEADESGDPATDAAGWLSIAQSIVQHFSDPAMQASDDDDDSMREDDLAEIVDCANEAIPFFQNGDVAGGLDALRPSADAQDYLVGWEGIPEEYEEYFWHGRHDTDSETGDSDDMEDFDYGPTSYPDPATMSDADLITGVHKSSYSEEEPYRSLFKKLHAEYLKRGLQDPAKQKAAFQNESRQPTVESLMAELAEGFAGLETVSDKLQNVEGAQVGEEGKVPVNKKSTLPNNKADKRLAGEPVEVKSNGHTGHALEKAPAVKDAPVKHHVQNSKDDPKKVSAEKSALLNKMDGSVNTQSPISGKGAKGLKK